LVNTKTKLWKKVLKMDDIATIWDSKKVEDKILELIQ
jgi:hypothetical protein